MIKSINGKITKDLMSIGTSKRFPPKLEKRAILLLMALSDLKGSLKEFWSITIEKPWCIIFKYIDGHFVDVEIGDYHD